MKSQIHNRAWLRALTALVAFFVATSVCAAEIAFPKTSYQAIGFSDQLPAEADAVLFVVIDQTTDSKQDAQWIRRVQKIVVDWMQPGRAVEVIQFSSYVPGRATQVITGGRLDPEPTQSFLDNMKRSQRGKFNKLHKQQIHAAKKQTVRAIKQVLTNATSDIPKSEILFNLHRVAKHISEYKAKRKTLLIVSDMLENSSVTSFYQAGSVRNINPDAEIANTKKNNLIAQFNDNVTVYIIGFGVGVKGYLDSTRLGNLKRFWQNYFLISNAKVSEIGTPLLLSGIE